MAIVIAVDGLIGAGKSTLLEYLEKIPTLLSHRLVVLQEDVDDWIDRGILKQYYEEPERYAFCFQLYVLFRRARLLDKAIEENPNAVIVSERTSVSDYMFAIMLYNSKKISDAEFNVYQMVYQKLKKVEVAGRILLKCSPEKALERCVCRNRAGEEKLTLEYLQQVEEYTNDFFQDDATTVPAIKISTEAEIHDVVDSTLIFLEDVVYDIDTRQERFPPIIHCFGSCFGAVILCLCALASSFFKSWSSMLLRFTHEFSNRLL